MDITTKLCLLCLLIWHQVNASFVSFVGFKYTSVNLSLIRNTQHKVLDSVHLPSCAVECSNDDRCRGFGYRESPDKNCLHILITESNENVTDFDGFEYFLIRELPSHCGQVQDNKTGLTLLDIGDGQLVVGYCEQEVDGGGWLVFQQRLDGSEDFYRNWTEYKEGFGKPWAEFWMGNKYLHQLTKDGNALLRIELEDDAGVKMNVKYTNFIVDSEAAKYRLHATGYEGGAPPGDSLDWHNGKDFTTYDEDNDLETTGNCAHLYKGGWWYASCHNSNLNGLYGSTEYGVGITWYYWKGHNYSMSRVRMLLKLKPGI